MTVPLCLANNFIEWGARETVPMTPLKLQKLLYLYYARHFYLCKKPPFPECFVKWPYGPALPDVYEALKDFGGKPIARPLRDMYGEAPSAEPGAEPFRTVFRDVITRFGRVPARELVDITHDGLPGSPCVTAWQQAEMGCVLSGDAVHEDGRVLFA